MVTMPARRGTARGDFRRIIVDMVMSVRQCSTRVLAYHSISDDEVDPLAVAPSLFARHMARLNELHIHVINTSEMLSRLRGGGSFGPAVCVTFDDGFSDFATHAVPVLERCGYPSTLFVTTSLVGTEDQWPSWQRPRSLLSWQELQSLADSGVAIGSHARSHRRLSDLDEVELRSELEASRTQLRELVPGYVDILAYPYGDQSEVVRQSTKQTGYLAGFGAGGLWGNNSTVDMYGLRRRVVTRHVTPEKIARIVTGRDDWDLALGAMRSIRLQRDSDETRASS